MCKAEQIRFNTEKVKLSEEDVKFKESVTVSKNVLIIQTIVSNLLCTCSNETANFF